MSKRKPDGPRGGAPARGKPSAAPARGKPSAAPPERGRRPPGSSFLAQSALPAAVLAVVTGIAALLGAANLGVALGVGTIAFTIALMYVMLNR